MKLKRSLGESDDRDGNHCQRSSGEDQFWVGPGAAEQIGKRQECGEDGELGKLYSHVDRFAEIRSSSEHARPWLCSAIACGPPLRAVQWLDS